MKFNRPIQILACAVNLLHPVETLERYIPPEPKPAEKHWLDKYFDETTPIPAVWEM